jgi:hypothetical protein
LVLWLQARSPEWRGQGKRLTPLEDVQLSGKEVVKGDNYSRNSENWDTRFDHNHLRITRIIRSLRVLGLEDEAKAFHNALEDATTRVSSRSREFWRRAAERALNLRPDLEIDDENDTKVGPEFLREFELERQARLAKAGQIAGTQDQVGSEARDEFQGEAPRNGLAKGGEASKPSQPGSEAVDGQEKKEMLVKDKAAADKLDGSEAAKHEEDNATLEEAITGGERVLGAANDRKERESMS